MTLCYNQNRSITESSTAIAPNNCPPLLCETTLKVRSLEETTTNQHLQGAELLRGVSCITIMGSSSLKSGFSGYLRDYLLKSPPPVTSKEAGDCSIRKMAPPSTSLKLSRYSICPGLSSLQGTTRFRV